VSEDVVAWLPKLNKLIRLLLRGLGLQNEISYSLVNLTQTTELDLSGNQLKSLTVNGTRVSYLMIGGNELQGPIPEWISHLANLVSLGLDDDCGLLATSTHF